MSEEFETLYTTQFGSRLFGTSTPQSDTDIKHIVLPAIGSLLRGRTLSNKTVTTNELTKNGPEDIDVEYVPIQCLARDFYEGQTYAMEIAYSIDGAHACQTHYESGRPGPMDPGSEFCLFIQELKDRFLTSNIKAMMGYVVSQSSLYSLKGERLNAAKAARDLLLSAPSTAKTLAQAMQVPAFAQAAQAAADAHGQFSISTYDDGKGGSAPCFQLLDKTIPFSVSIENALKPAQNCVKRFGHRTESASIANVEWKATMHAVRIVDEGIALMRDGRISLPIAPERAEYLLSIRRGEVPLAVVEAEISAKITILESLVEHSPRPAITPELTAEFDRWLEAWLMRLYGLQAAPAPARRPALGR